METQTLDFSQDGSRDWLKGLLRSQVISVVFEKADGSERTLKCTLMESKISEEHKPKGVKKAQNSDVQPVFDVENDGWRSFRWDSIRSIVLSIGE